MNAKRWLTIFLVLILAAVILTCSLVVIVDPFFHYHAPLSDRFFYTLDNQRSINIGIVRHFDYDALITGSSMTVNFNTSEIDERFGTRCIKVPASGASFYEINNLINAAFDSHPDLKYVFRGIDRSLLFDAPELLRTDLGEYPEYLYDRNILNDYKYILNADVIFNRTLTMLADSRRSGFVPGCTSFDDYSNTMEDYKGEFGLASLSESFRYELGTVGEPVHMTDAERNQLTENITQNVIRCAEEHPDTQFYYFFPPYSLGYWHDRIASGLIVRQFEAEQLAAELMLQCDNIRLFDFTGRTDIISDVNNYRDLLHYGEWINSLIIKWMQEDQYRLTEDNYLAFFEQQLAYYSSADFSELLTQERYGCDFYAAALLNEELTGIPPRPITEEELRSGELRRAELLSASASEQSVLHCTGALGRDAEQPLSDFLYGQDFIGLKLCIPDASEYSYLCFKGRNTGFDGQPSVFAYDENGNPISSVEENSFDLRGGWQIFTLDLRDADGPTDIIFNGGYPDYTGHSASSFEFTDFMLY